MAPHRVRYLGIVLAIFILIIFLLLFIFIILFGDIVNKQLCQDLNDLLFICNSCLRAFTEVFDIKVKDPILALLCL